MNKKKDEKKIDLKETHDLHYWSEELNLKVEELTEIIKQVGPGVHDVRLHIAKKLLINWPLAY
jgi:hypothetical protein